MAKLLKSTAFLLLLRLVVAQDDRATDPNNHFIFPPVAGPKFSKDQTVYRSNPSYVLGDSQPFEWTTNRTAITLKLVREGSQNQQWLLDAANSVNFLYWNGSVSEDLQPEPRDVFWLGAWDSEDANGTPVFFSHYFNLTKPLAVTPTSSLSSSTTSSSSSTGTGPSTTFPKSTSSSSASATSTPSQAPLSTNTTAIGAGVGGGIGGALIIIAVAFWVLRQRKHQKEFAVSTGPASQQFQDYSRESYPQMYCGEQKSVQMPFYPVELSPKPKAAQGGRPAELSTE